jgi:hypothetical protein
MVYIDEKFDSQVQNTTAYLIDDFPHISLQIKSSVTEWTAWLSLLQLLDVTAKHVFRR